jgi:putative spermidine/putrescine transport system permease protein/spermidine/putrescine transport system permease protein
MGAAVTTEMRDIAAADADYAAVDARVRRSVRREQMGLLALMVPGLAIVACLLIVPLGWLIGLSFVHNNAFSLANYARIFGDSFYARSLWTTLILTGTVTAICAVLGYLLAYALTMMPMRMASVCLIFIALPFWTSVLVRTYAWIVLLQNNGVINKFLLDTDLIDRPLALINNLTGTYIGMVHLMLPLMVFPIYAGLRQISPDFMRAALGFGASPAYAFWRVFFPLSKHGLMAGTLVVFVLSLGFYITPALMGGGKVLMISVVIARDINFNRDWGPASAIAALFVLAVLAIFALASRLMSFDRMLNR